MGHGKKTNTIRSHVSEMGLNKWVKREFLSNLHVDDMRVILFISFPFLVAGGPQGEPHRLRQRTLSQTSGQLRSSCRSALAREEALRP